LEMLPLSDAVFKTLHFVGPPQLTADPVSIAQLPRRLYFRRFVFGFRNQQRLGLGVQSRKTKLLATSGTEKRSTMARLMTRSCST